MRILAIAGSVRRDSHNARLLRHVAERAPAGVEIEIWDGLKSIPPYDEDDDAHRPRRRRSPSCAQAIAEADGLLIATPEYNSSIPGVLKNAIDWASRPRATTPAAGQAGGGDRRHHRQLRRRLGAGRAAQGARLDRRPGRRPRAAARARPTRRSTTTAPLISADHDDRMRSRCSEPLAAEIATDRELAVAA